MERPMTAVGRAAAAAQPPSFSCLLPNGELCITQEPTHTLLCLTVSGELRNAVDPSGRLLNFPMGCVCDEGALYVADGFSNQVHKLRLPDFKHKASTALSLGLDYPHGVCIGACSGVSILFVADWGNHRILAIDPATLGLMYEFGSKGSAPGEFRYPRGVTSLEPGGRERLLVADTDNDRLQILSTRGEPLMVVHGIEQPYAAICAPPPPGSADSRACSFSGSSSGSGFDSRGSSAGGGDGGSGSSEVSSSSWCSDVPTATAPMTAFVTASADTHAAPTTTAFVATMSGRLCLMPLTRVVGAYGDSGGGEGDESGSGPTFIGRLGAHEEMRMPSEGRVRCSLCTDGRRFLVAGFDEARQLHLLTNRNLQASRGVAEALRARAFGGGGPGRRVSAWTAGLCAASEP